MVNRGVLLLLDLNLGAVLEAPLDNVGLLACALDVLGLVESGPELGEVLELDVVPDMGERGYRVIISVSRRPFSLEGQRAGGGMIVPLITADSTTEVLVGIVADMFRIGMEGQIAQG